jgi:DNA-binding GntR family transcriptional regulator
MSLADPRSLTERTYSRLRDEILSSRLKPGQKLRLRDLCEMTGASLSVVREAMDAAGSGGSAERRSAAGLFRALSGSQGPA